MKEESKYSDLLNRQKKFFEKGETRAIRFRKAQLGILRHAVLRYREDLETALYDDLGKSGAESYATEIGFVLSEISFAERRLKQWAKPKRVRSSLSVFPAKSFVVREPYGCALIVGPFNYPVQLLLGPLVAAIAAGNCAVLSPSELTPHTAETVEKLIRESFPSEYIGCAVGDASVKEALMRLPFDKIFFTGSVRVGKLVMRAAAEHLIPVTLELGGKSPAIVDETAKLSLAAERIAWGKLLNAGQTCVAPDYVLVARERLPAFIEELKNAMIRLYGEKPEESPDYGRIVSERHACRLQEILREDRDCIVYGGETDVVRRFVAPTILLPAQTDAACMREEIFGPLLPVFAYDTIGEAIGRIRCGEKPLALYLFTEDRRTVRQVLGAVPSGGAAVNDTISHLINPHLPFGGVGASGMGKYHGKFGFDEFSHLRGVLLRSTNVRVTLAYPPYTERKLRLMRRVFK